MITLVTTILNVPLEMNLFVLYSLFPTKSNAYDASTNTGMILYNSCVQVPMPESPL